MNVVATRLANVVIDFFSGPERPTLTIVIEDHSFSLSDWDAALFDLDGVLTPTAEVHMRAWQQLFVDFLTRRGVTDQPYVESDYFTYIDGLPRDDGVRALLASRDIVLADGDPSDGPETETVCGLGNRKNAFFAGVLRDEGVTPYTGSVLFIDALTARGIKMAVVSSSKNAGAVLKAAGLHKQFAIVVDGNVATERGLPGKPAPDTYADAAAQLGVPIAKSIVFEDAVSGVQAGRNGNFGLVVGVDRGVGADRLREVGADLVVADLAELVP